MDYLKANLHHWNQTVEHHMQSEFYDVEHFLQGKTSLRDVELGLLGSVQNKTILHLQCHFGQDTLSLQRMGAQCTGVDFSDQAILQAKKLNRFLDLKASFICSDIYMLPQIHEHDYDIVFTTYGTIGWLPNVQQWASIVSQYMKPGGKFVFVEFHPVVWMYNNQFTKVEYSYFNDTPIVEDVQGSYANKEADIRSQNISWNHGMAEVLQALMDNGLNIEHCKEYNYSPYPCFDDMKQIASQKFILPQFDGKIPMLYSVVATKPLL
jgi:ubiquinone/menaquinone biosynthesis C-methylase UbiE